MSTIGSGNPQANNIPSDNKSKIKVEETKQTTLDKIIDGTGNLVKEQTKEGSYLRDNYIGVGAGAVVGIPASVAGVIKINKAYPQIGETLGKVFVQNGKAWIGGLSIGTSALLAEDGIQSLKEGSKLKGGLELGGATVAGLGGAELVGRNFNIPYLNKALTGPAEFIAEKAVKNAGGIGGTVGLAGSGYLVKTGIDDLKDGKPLKGSGKIVGGTVIGLGGTELIGRNYNIKYLDKALSGPATAIGKFVEKNVQGVSGTVLLGAGGTGVVLGAKDIKEGYEKNDLKKKLIGAAEATGGGLATLGGTELLARQFNIPVLNQAFTGPAKFVAKHAQAFGGVSIAGAGTYGIVRGTGDFKEGKELIGAGEIAAGSIAVLGGTEMTARHLGIPVLDKALTGPANFIKNNVKATIGAASIGGGAYLIKHGVDDVKDGKTENSLTKKTIGGAEIAGGSTAILGGAELIGRNFGIKYLDRALTGPIKALFTTKAGLAISGGAVGATGLYSMFDGAKRIATHDDLKNNLIGVAEVTGGITAANGGVSIIGTAVGNEKLAKVFVNSGKTIAAAGLLAGSVTLGKYSYNDIKDKGFHLANSAAAGASTVGTLGAAEMIGRQFGIKYMDRALTGPAEAVAKVIFNSKTGLVLATAASATAGVGLAVDGAKRLAGTKPLAKVDAIKNKELDQGIAVAELTASGTALAGATSMTGVLTGSEKLTQVFPKSIKVIGGVGLVGGAVVLGKHTVKDIAKNGVSLVNTGTGTAAALAAAGGVEMMAQKTAAFQKAWKPVMAAGLGVAAYKLGEHTFDQAKEMVKDPNSNTILKTAGLGAATVAAGGASVTLAGKTLGIPALENVGINTLRGIAEAGKGIYKFSITNPGITLGAIAVAGAGSYYLYTRSKKDENENPGAKSNTDKNQMPVKEEKVKTEAEKPKTEKVKETASGD